MATHPQHSQIPLIAKLRERITGGIYHSSAGEFNADLTEEEIIQLARILRPSELAEINERMGE